MRLTALTRSGRHIVHRLAPIAALAFLALSGCGDGNLSGSRYVLDSIGAQSLPAISHQNDFARYVTLSDTIALTSATRGYHAYRFRVEDTNGNPIETLSAKTDFTYEIDVREPPVLNGDIAITYICPPNAGCIAGPHLTGKVEGSILSLRVRHQSPELLRLYRRD